MMGWNAKMAGRAALPARSYCRRHKRLLVGWNGEGENVAKSTSGKFTPLPPAILEIIKVRTNFLSNLTVTGALTFYLPSSIRLHKAPLACILDNSSSDPEITRRAGAEMRRFVSFFA